MVFNKLSPTCCIRIIDKNSKGCYCWIVTKQGEIAKKLIEAGKETDVDEMEIILDNTKGFHFDAPIDEKCKIDTVIGSDEKVVIKVKYK